MTPLKGSANPRGAGCLSVFGAIFIVAGLVPGAIALLSLHDWFQARDWQPVPATVLEAGLERGDDTFRVTARYRYAVDGIDYEGQRVSLHGGSDNIGDFHQATFARLDRHRRDGKPITVYVDPASPSDAVVVRQIRWGLFGFMMIFPVVFGGAGTGIILAGVHGRRQARERQRLQAQHPEQPWLWYPQWNDGVVQEETSKALWVAGFFTLVWNLISVPLPFLLWDEIATRGNYAALLGLLFPVVGIGLIAWTVRSYLAYRRWGRARLALDTFPGVPGGQMAGMLHLPGALPAGTRLEAKLSCIRRRTSGSGKNRSTREEVLWQDQQRLRLERHHVLDGTRIHLAFPIPGDQPATNDADPSDRILWRIHLNADVPGVDFDASLEVPVFATGQSAAPRDAPLPVASDAAEPAHWQGTGVVVSYGPGGREFYFPPARHRGMALVVSLVTLVFGGATALLWSADAHFMAIVFGLFALLLAWMTLTAWLMRSRLTVSSGQLRLKRGMTGLGGWHDHPAGTLSGIGAKGGSTFGRTRYYDLVATTVDNRSIKLADTLAGRRDTEALAAMLARELGLGRR